MENTKSSKGFAQTGLMEAEDEGRKRAMSSLDPHWNASKGTQDGISPFCKRFNGRFCRCRY